MVQVQFNLVCHYFDVIEKLNKKTAFNNIDRKRLLELRAAIFRTGLYIGADEIAPDKKTKNMAIIVNPRDVLYLEIQLVGLGD